MMPQALEAKKAECLLGTVKLDGDQNEPTPTNHKTTKGGLAGKGELKPYSTRRLVKWVSKKKKQGRIVQVSRDGPLNFRGRRDRRPADQRVNYPNEQKAGNYLRKDCARKVYIRATKKKARMVTVSLKPPNQ